MDMPNGSHRERGQGYMRSTTKLGAKRRMSGTSAVQFGPLIVGNAGEALDLIGNVLAKANEYSIVAQDLDGKFPLFSKDVAERARLNEQLKTFLFSTRPLLESSTETALHIIPRVRRGRAVQSLRPAQRGQRVSEDQPQPSRN
jgi:hypothetical protein